MANTKISALTANTNPNWNEEFVYAYNNANGKITLNTMKAFVWGAWVTTLTADANIWELTDGVYETAYDLYYITWSKTPTGSGTNKQRIVVVVEWTARVYYVARVSSTGSIRIWYWRSVSSSSGDYFRIGAWDESLSQYGESMANPADHIQPLSTSTLTQLVTDATGTSTISITSDANNLPYVWATHTIIIESIKSGDNYSVALWTGITNPLGLTLPTSSVKKCVITVVPTSSSTAIVTWCTIEN